MRLWAIVLGRARCDVRIASDSRPLRQRAKRRLRAGTGSHSTAGVDLGGPANALARLSVGDIATRLRELSPAFRSSSQNFEGSRQAANQPG